MKRVHKKTRMVVKAVTFCLLLPVIVSCSTFGGKKNEEKDLLEHIGAFNTALRWEDYKMASSWIPQQSQPEFWKKADALQTRVRLMDYEIRNVSLEHDGFYGTATLRFRYYFKDGPHIRNKILQQRWHYIEKEETWQLVQFDLNAFMPEEQ